MYRLLNTWRIYALGALAALLYAGILIYLSGMTLLLSLAILAVSAGVFLAVTDERPALKWLIFLLPLSMEIPIGFGDSKIIFPSEVLIIILLVALSIKYLFLKRPDTNFLRHPLSIAIAFYMASMLLTAIFSTQPLVSIKYTLVNLSYILVFYFLVHDYLKEGRKKWVQYFFLYAIPLFAVIVYTTYRHSLLGLGKTTSLEVMQPFYSDHCIYSACTAFLIPVFLVLSLYGKRFGLSTSYRMLSTFILIALAAGTFLSYGRAAWISLGAAACMYMILRLRIKPVTLVAGLLVLGSLAWWNYDSIMHQSRSNKNNSTVRDPSLEEEAMSVTNTSSDVSNAERLNRWSCAWRMFVDKPLTGFGPGTYQFQYLPYQRQDEMTRISVTTAYNNPFGRGGSAHSEYLLTLSEMGLPGFLSYAGILFTAIFIGMRAYSRALKRSDKLLVAAVVCGIVTYATHTLFNNYLNNDKAAGLFWVFICLLAVMDIRFSHNQKTITHG